MSKSQHRTQTSTETMALKAMYQLIMEEQHGKPEALAEYLDAFLYRWADPEYLWEGYHCAGDPLPENWRDSITRFFNMAIPMNLLHEAIDVAMKRENVQSGDRFTYMCGVVYTTVRKVENRTLELVGKAKS